MPQSNEEQEIRIKSIESVLRILLVKAMANEFMIKDSGLFTKEIQALADVKAAKALGKILAQIEIDMKSKAVLGSGEIH